MVKKLSITLLVLIFVFVALKFPLIAANYRIYFSDHKKVSNIEFGSEYGSKLDIYMPGNEKADRPVIVFFHGGRWSHGSKNDYLFLAVALTARGYTVVMPDYVKYDQVKYPIWQYDAAKAVVWVRNNIKQYGADPEKLVLMGYSAGGHIAAMLAANNEFMKKEGGDRNWIRAVVGVAAPYDYLSDDADVVDMFNGRDNFKYMQVPNYIDGKQAPIIMLWGKDDDVVEGENINRMKDILDKKGGPYEVKVYDGLDHSSILTSYLVQKLWEPSVLEDTDRFLKKYLN